MTPGSVARCCIGYIAVLDGHGREGREVAQLAAELLTTKIKEKSSWKATDLSKTIMEVDENLFSLNGGSTIACALFQRTTNVLLASKGGTAFI